MSVEEKIKKIIGEIIERETVDLNQSLMDDLELSSLEILTMFSDIEDEFNIKIPTEEIQTIVCGKDIVDIVERKINK